jgi:hypothetical protein
MHYNKLTYFWVLCHIIAYVYTYILCVVTGNYSLGLRERYRDFENRVRRPIRCKGDKVKKLHGVGFNSV